MAWAPSGHRLYFARTRIDHPSGGGYTPYSRLFTASIAAGTPGHLTRVNGGAGLSDPSADPTSGRVAAVRVEARTCGVDTGTTMSTIVLLNPRSGVGHDLLTVTTPPTTCPSPVQDLAWSPDGAQIAFDQQLCCSSADLYEGEIDLVAADGSDGASYHVVVPQDGRHLTSSPTWHNAYSLWFQREVKDTGDSDHRTVVRPNLYSVSYRNGSFGDMVKRTASPKFPEIGPSFG
jgi:dipeptidyl aminopeptidase/acylaminoacyl peptidase